MSVRRFGMIPVEIDILNGASGDLSIYSVYEGLLGDARAGKFSAIIAAPPCGTFSVARMPIDGSTQGPQLVRDRDNILGLTHLSQRSRTHVLHINRLVERMCNLVEVIVRSGGVYIIENPVDRGDTQTSFYRAFWKRHGPLWLMPKVLNLYATYDGAMFTFAQCGLGSPFQKFTTLMYSSELSQALSSIAEAVCTHEDHNAVAFGIDYAGSFRSSMSAAYPRAMNLLLAEAIARVRPPGGHISLFVGSATPHTASVDVAAAHIPIIGTVNSASVRRLRCEPSALLAVEMLPRGNLPTATTWDPAPVELRELPSPVYTNQLIQSSMLEKLKVFFDALSSSTAKALEGNWQVARSMRPPPLYGTEAESTRPNCRGWSWARRTNSDIWDPIVPSAYPHDPPKTNLNLFNIVEYARKHHFVDMQAISWLAHGVPGPEHMELHTLIGAHHVGALRHYVEYAKCQAKDRSAGFASAGECIPTVWPMLADPTNLVINRAGKARMTVDKSITLVDGVASYNDAVLDDDVLRGVRVKMVNVAQLARSFAILSTSMEQVRFWGFDIKAYFRQIGIQRADQWKSGTTRGDGYGKDSQIQFGMREAMDTTGRVTIYIVFSIRTECSRLDKEYPPCSNSRAQQYVRRRVASMRTAADPKVKYGNSAQYCNLSAVFMFVDDVGAASINDILYRPAVAGLAPEPYRVYDLEAPGGPLISYRRAQLHYEAAIGIIRHFGFREAEGKTWFPCHNMVFLGMLLAGAERLIHLTEEKRHAYLKSVESLMHAKRDASGSHIVDFKTLSSLVHQLLHASTVIVLGRQHLYYLWQTLHIRNRVKSTHRCTITKAALVELSWWHQWLKSKHNSVPFAFMSSFPSLDEPNVLVTYSDASREILARRTESGYGSWCILGDTLYYIEGRWTVPEIHLLSINVLELKAMNMGLFMFTRLAVHLGMSISESCEFTDNTAAEHSANNGTGHTERMAYLIRERFDYLVSKDIASAVVRITSIDNDLADGLSRGGLFLSDALRLAAASGRRIRRITVTDDVRCTDALRAMLMPSHPF